jgi:hypothetical protein
MQCVLASRTISASPKIASLAVMPSWCKWLARRVPNMAGGPHTNRGQGVTSARPLMCACRALHRIAPHLVSACILAQANQTICPQLVEADIPSNSVPPWEKVSADIKESVQLLPDDFSMLTLVVCPAVYDLEP